jgi:mRNA interferase MazF
MEFSGEGSEQSGYRPGLVFQNNVGNSNSPNLIALPLTSVIKKLGQPTHVLIKAEDTALLKDSVVLCENPERISKKRIGRYITTLSADYMRQIAAASLLASSAISYMDADTLIAVWEKATKLNGNEVA